MHQYLRAVGFSEIKNRKEVKDLLNEIVQKPDKKEYIETEQGSVLIEYQSMISESLGMTLRGELDEDNHLMLDFYYPFCLGKNISTNEEAGIERHADKESFGGICEDNRIGVSLIFFLQNGMEYMKDSVKKKPTKGPLPLYFSGLSLQGKIMLPIRKNETERRKIKETTLARTQLIEAARHGDENALENLTLDEIDTYTMISKKILKEDVFSLVDTFFMPYGIECDQYSIMGEIEEVSLEQNRITQEDIYVLGLNCNGMSVTVCINAMDLLGEPQVGRRFKGNIWLQGRMDYTR
ncbi:MAG: DUF3881 family protein [Lachnospiraceae bacterium]|nr:DUF3881 family protein [Lachnospiraceae bacterium]